MTEKAIRRPNTDSSHTAPSTLSTPPPTPPHSVYINPPLCVLILHTIAFCFRLEQQFMNFWCSNLHFRGLQAQFQVSPRRCSGPQARRRLLSALMLIGKRQSYRHLIKLPQKSTKEGIAKMTHTGAYNPSFAHTKLAEMIRRSYIHGH